jgi:8-amino-3,8-dideoxy-alpha-D-manno-octulosonate transaminase
MDDSVLAIDGGKPARTRENPAMFPGGMEMDEREERAVLDVIRSKRLFRYYGPEGTASKTEEYEKEFAKRTSARYALAVNSCTSALVLALLAAGVQPGDEVIVPAYTFIATASAVVAANAVPVLAEIDGSFTLDPEDFERKITPRTKAVIPVHMRGASCDMDAVMAIAKKHGIKVIEDAAQACGGAYNGRPLGSIGDAGCFSFQYHKIITAGEGGAITTNDKELYVRARSIHDCGSGWRSFAANEESLPVFSGFNFRMGELNAAVLLVQLKRRDGMIARMRHAAGAINAAIAKFPGVSPRRSNSADGDVGICCMFTAMDRKAAARISEALKAEGVDVDAIGGDSVPDWHIYTNWRPILERRGNNDAGFPFTLSDRRYSADMCPKTLDLLNRVVHLNVSPLLADEDTAEICRAIEKVLGGLA